jgi:hypothetical protein
MNKFILEPTITRIDPSFPKTIDCEEGWWDIVSHCTSELSKIDEHFIVHQVKEKFGGLRYYFKPSNRDDLSRMNEIVSKYEKICSMTCEKTGKPGILMRRSGQYKTLHSSFTQHGWEVVSPAVEA